MADPLKPSVALLCKLGSAIVHAEEFLSAQSHEYDKTAFDQLTQDAEIKTWIKDMQALAMLPVKR